MFLRETLDKPRSFLPPGITVLLIVVLGYWLGRPFAELEGDWGLWETARMMGLVFVVDVAVNAAWVPFSRREEATTPESLGHSWGTIIFSLLVWAPLFEEFIFRYVLVGALYDVSPTLALGASGVLFGLVHSRAAVPKIITGALFAWLFVCSGSLLVPILMHFGWNAFVLVASYDKIDRAIRRGRGY